jgi:glycine cleavage system H protein
MQFPEHLKYTADHEWIAVEGNEAIVGITDFAQGELGDIVYVDINTIGKKIQKGDVFGTVEAVKTVSDLFSPITGTILTMNDSLNASPEQVNAHPYEKGWMVKVSIDNPDELNSLLSAAEYRKLIGA